MIVGQAIVAASLVAMLVAYLWTRENQPSADTTIKQLLLWYPLSAPWLLVRVPLLYLCTDVWGWPLWMAVVVEFIVERPLFFLTAREIATRVK